MSKPRRNDPCPCGSGEKYKKCCGTSNVIEFNPALYNNELERLNVELAEFAIDNFESELKLRSEKYVDSYMVGSDNEELDNYLYILMAWLILYEPLENGKTIFDIYYAKQQHKINHSRTKKIFSSWYYAKPDVFKIVAVEDQPVPIVTVESLSTDNTYHFKRDDETDDDIGNLIIGTILPYVNIYDFLFGIVYIREDQEQRIFQLLDEMKRNHEKIEKVFPRLLAETIHPHGDISLEWVDPRHEMVADLFGGHMMEKNFDEKLIASGILIWNIYCYQYNPTIIKPRGYAAALDYIVQINVSENSTITQSQLAQEYGTTTGAISTNYRKITESITNELSNLHLKIYGHSDST